MFFKLLLICVTIVHPLYSCQIGLTDDVINARSMTNASADSIPIATRIYWMREANKVLKHQGICPFYPFAAVIVNHTASNGLGELVCSGVNQISLSGNPSRHGEMVAISNCTDILTAKDGRYRLSTDEAIKAFNQLSIYSNGESCPMCASAIRWTGFKEYIYGTSIRTLVKAGWDQIRIDSSDIFAASVDMMPNTIFVGSVLNNETDPHFMWQYNDEHSCPSGCGRSGSSNLCEVEIPK